MYNIIIQYCIHCSVLTTKSLISIHHHTFDSLTPFTHLPSLHPPFPLVTTNQLFASMSLLMIHCCCFFIFHMCVKSYGISLSLPDLFPLAQSPLGPSMLSQTARLHLILNRSVPKGAWDGGHGQAGLWQPGVPPSLVRPPCIVEVGQEIHIVNCGWGRF